MEGTERVNPPASTPAPVRWPRRLVLFLVLVVVAVIIIAAASVYVLTTPAPIPLTISDGSVLGLIEGNLTTLGSATNLLILYFNATTYASQSASPTSTLMMQMVTWTYYVGGPEGHYYDGGYIETTVNVTIRGHFASNLHPSVLRFTISQIGQRKTGSLLDYVWSEPAYQAGTNVTFDPNQELWVEGTGSVTGTETCVASGGGGPFFDFAYRDWVDAKGFVGHNRFVSIRATIEGPFSPAISVEAALAIVDLPA